ncbi:MAG UNVERIFIED_CONTAM: hypothetical protein LVR29_34720 [Microcystis novacekii LVE1205-3]
MEKMLQSLASNLSLGTAAIILPGICTEQPSQEWLLKQQGIAIAARRLFPEGQLLSTIALGSDMLRSDEMIHEF